MAFSFLKDHGVLGINSRNLEYLKPFNRKKAVRMADSKLATKQFLSTRGVPVPKLIAAIRSYQDLEKFDFSTLPESFVLKPNAGYGGEGIVVITEKILDGVWQKIGGDKITEADLREHISDILDGEYSIASLPDIAFFESRVNSVEFIPGLKVEGLPDVRVIVHNLIPVMAMLRIPTPESNGKANVHLGGIGLGIDLAAGKTTHAVQFNKLLTELPGGIPAAGHVIPFFDEILKIASEAQIHTNLGYLAADLVVDSKDGPVLLEVNARAGLMVQIANLAPLKERLERIKGLKVESPEKGVKLSKELFGKSKIKKKKYPKKTVVDYIEDCEILLKEKSHRVKAELDATHETTAIDAQLAEKLHLLPVGESAKQIHLKIILGGERITTVAEKEDLTKANYKVILGRRDLGNFLINPISREEKILPKEKQKDEIPKIDFHAIDKALTEIDKKIKLLHYLKPTNLLAEKKKFFASSSYDPVFNYRQLKFDPDLLLANLDAIKIPSDGLGKIFQEKKIEISQKIKLLQSLGRENFTELSCQLYGFPSEENIQKAQKILAGKPKKFPAEKSTIDAEAATLEFQKVFEKYNLKNWKFVFREDLVADALAGKSGTLFIRSLAKWSPERLRSTIAHEVETHILRGENGKNQNYEIFSRGVGNYLETEEGLAIFNQNLVLQAAHEKEFWPVLSFLAVAESAEKSFRQIFDFVKKHNFSDERAWKTAVKIKRGLRDASQAGGFTKEAIYFSGLQKIQQFVDNGGDLKKLYLGKIRIEDVEKLTKIPEIRPAKLLPDFYTHET
ncbi:DUF1704 domain-containing protein [Candidatus Gracilibacteria bacterium]|nr:DUF1704 domain-containing protein [Candidatus Gracilibacteria bacterium]MCF7856138.1 DUF1704 domain-containing protein [Candidatus Gracilibacteria bacterium]MCF7896604.1 DUF1704 domain-containing protein [Candidatus Gracilibacteria bacterium]